MGQQPGRRVQCGTHKIDADIAEPEVGESTVTCPTCGQADTLEFATAEASKAVLGDKIDGAIKNSGASCETGSTDTPRWVFGEPSAR